MITATRHLGALLVAASIALCASACADSTTTTSTSTGGGTGGTGTTQPPSTISFYRVLLRGTLKAGSGAGGGGTGGGSTSSKDLHDMLAKSEHTQAIAKSETSHSTFLNVTDPTDFLGVDTWSNLDDLKAFYADPDVQAAWAPLLSAPPTVEIWEHPTEWVEWGSVTPATLVAPIFLFHIRNRLSATSTEESRLTHNMVAGGASQQKAISLGDHAHSVNLRTDDTRELLFLDLWVDPMKAQQFFTDPETIKGAGELFVGAPDVVVFALTDWYQW